jgi:hypothetical protein
MRPVTGSKRGEGKPETFTSWASPTSVGNATRPDLHRLADHCEKANGCEAQAIKVELRRRMHDRTSRGRCMASDKSYPVTTNTMLFPATSTSCASSKTRQSAVAKRSGSSQSTAREEVGEVYSGLREVDTTTPRSAPLSPRPLLRHPSFIRAVCVDAPYGSAPGGAQR